MLDQHGLATRSQLLKLGLHRNAIRRAIATGRWRRARAGVYAASDVAPSREQRVLSGILAVGGDAVASHGAAAWVHGLLGFREPTNDVTTSTPRRASGVRVHRTDLEDRDRERVRGIPVTRVGRTIVDLASILDVARLEAVLDDALRRKLVRVALLQRLVDERGTRGRRGAGVLARLLAERRGDYVPTESRLEALFVELIAGAGLREPERQLELRDEEGRIFAEADFAYEKERIAIWLDGIAYHGDPAIMRKDLDQSQEAIRMGWRVLRLTWEMVTKRGPKVIETVRTMLELSTISPSGPAAGPSWVNVRSDQIPLRMCPILSRFARR